MLMLGAIGVVFGDIGTSPLYAFREVFADGRVPLSPANVLSATSMFIWALIFVVALKYVGLVMRADNDGEGGMMALLALASRSVGDRPRVRAGMLAMGAFGVALFFGDGVITPAISVLSAVEGMEVATPAAKPYVLPIALTVLALLFVVQRHGTASLGRFFGPVMVLWFVILGAIGLLQILQRPQVLAAVSPVYALEFMGAHPHIAFITLGAVFLCLTGAEALYADMGHFGKRPIRLAWFALVMPALVLNYLGQGALVLSQPKAAENPFYLLAPPWALVGLVVLATAATVIASQALISGAFSAAKQSMQLDYLPRMRIEHTSSEEVGQIYVGAINWLLLVGVVLTVLLFRNSSAMAAAYGISVSLLMVITTCLTYFVVRHGWHYPLPVAAAATGVFLLVDLVFFSSNALKITDGGWFPLLMAALVYAVMSTWRRGRELIRESNRANSIELPVLLDSLFAHPPPRVAGTAVFLNAVAGVAPSALLHSMKHYKVLHERNLFVNVRSHEVPWVPPEQRSEVTPLGHDCWQVTIHYGFKDRFDLPLALQGVQPEVGALDSMQTSYFLSREVVVPRAGGGMAQWREQLFTRLQLNASAMAEFLCLPTNSVVELGSKIEI
ncbi:MAG: potassium transporter Kup [Proteobacteria bacterium]|nr:potassium transporter Kup [Pseudomonadota bacterium]MBS0495134.1 potassium transporter Kup [Pseudomonadota bacterium]